MTIGESRGAPAAPQPAPAVVPASARGDVHAEVVVLGSGPGGYTAAFRAAGATEVVPEIIVSVGAGDDDHASTRMLLAFYGSTPAYRPVLDAHGWGDLQPELNAMSKQGRWQEMAGLIDDALLDLIVAHGTPQRVAATITARTAGPEQRALGDRVLAVVPSDELEKAADWFGDSERSIAQIDAFSVGAGMALIGGGYLKLLRHRRRA